MMKTKQMVLAIIIGVFFFSSLIFMPFLATPASAQVYFYTPTAEANGNIYYVVKENDTCDTIALLNNVSIDVLRSLNNLDLDQCRFLQVGQKLLLGIVPTQAATAGPSPTPTVYLPTPLPEKGYGTICVYLYDDVNGNALAEIDEITDTGLAGGEVSVINKEGDYSKTGTTLSTGEAICFENAPEGEYTVSMAIPNGYNPTSSQIYTISLKAGDTSTIDFSAQAGSLLKIVNDEQKPSWFLAVIGGLILVAGLILALYVKFFLRK